MEKKRRENALLLKAFFEVTQSEKDK